MGRLWGGDDESKFSMFHISGTHPWLPRQTLRASPDSLVLGGRGNAKGFLDTDLAVPGYLSGPCAICLRAARRVCLSQLQFAAQRLGCMWAGQNLSIGPSGLHIWGPAPGLYILISVPSDLGFTFLPSQILFLFCKLRCNPHITLYLFQAYRAVI